MNEDKCFEIDFYEWYDNRLMDGYNLSLSKEEVKRFVNTCSLNQTKEYKKTGAFGYIPTCLVLSL